MYDFNILNTFLKEELENVTYFSGMAFTNSYHEKGAVHIFFIDLRKISCPGTDILKKQLLRSKLVFCVLCASVYKAFFYCQRIRKYVVSMLVVAKLHCGLLSL
ncbi:hypothetical protein NL108_007501 [Boleophthalmus pectinirostris]|nr:hypothetical protein NL108_007501 [Boleophthalmus pectinirostris]